MNGYYNDENNLGDEEQYQQNIVAAEEDTPPPPAEYAPPQISFNALPRPVRGDTEGDEAAPVAPPQRSKPAPPPPKRPESPQYEVVHVIPRESTPPEPEDLDVDTKEQPPPPIPDGFTATPMATLPPRDDRMEGGYSHVGNKSPVTPGGGAPQVPTTIYIKENDPSGQCCCLNFTYRTANARAMQQHYKCPSMIVKWYQSIEWLRWQIISLLQVRPFMCCASLEMIENPKKNCAVLFLFSLATINLFDLLIASVIIGLNMPILVALSLDQRRLALGMGLVASRNFALCLLLPTRNSIWDLFLGLPFERLIVYHRWVGRWAFACAMFHFFAWLQYWDEEDVSANEEMREDDRIKAGILCLVASGVMAALGINFVRRQLFEFFLKTHWMLAVLVLWAGDKHDRKFMEKNNVMIFAILMWVFDMIWRIYMAYGRSKKAHVSSVKFIGASIIRIQFIKEKFVFNAGQYVFINLPFVDITQWHPFSIASTPYDKQITIYCRVVGGFTNRLKELADRGGDWSHLDFFVEGPYGRPTMALHQYESILLICGGIGITPFTSIFQSLLREVLEGRPVRRIQFVWCVREAALCEHFAEIAPDLHVFGQKQRKASNIPEHMTPDQFVVGSNAAFNCQVEMSYHLTRLEDPTLQSGLKNKYPFIQFGRPSMEQLITGIKEKHERAAGPNSIRTGVAVLGCGPQRMIHDIERYSAIHNVSCHTEIFEF